MRMHLNDAFSLSLTAAKAAAVAAAVAAAIATAYKQA